MREIQGNIWYYYQLGHWITITTNGTVNRGGACVMGRGVALEAKNRFGGLPYRLGRHLQMYGNRPRCFHDLRIITFPVKFHYSQKADLGLIEESCRILVEGMVLLGLDRLYMVRPGCGNGGLNWKDVKPVLERYLDDRFIIVQL